MELSQGFFTLQTTGDLVLCYPHLSTLLYSSWHRIGLGLGETPAPLPFGLRLSVTSRNRSPPTAPTATIEHWKQAVGIVVTATVTGRK